MDFTVSSSNVRLAFFDDSLDFEQPFRLTNLPPDDWLIKQFSILFASTDSEAEMILRKVKAAAAGTNDHFATHQVDRTPDISGTQQAFKDSATSVTTEPTQGDGWANQVYLEGNQPLGQFSIIVSSIRIMTMDSGHEYTIKVYQLGGIRLMVTLELNKTIPESEYRNVFRQMFHTLGLPADRVASYEFEYTPSNW